MAAGRGFDGHLLDLMGPLMDPPVKARPAMEGAAAGEAAPEKAVAEGAVVEGAAAESQTSLDHVAHTSAVEVGGTAEEGGKAVGGGVTTPSADDEAALYLLEVSGPV